MSVGIYLIDWLDEKPWFKLSRNESKIENTICKVFSFMSWQPFRSALDISRTAIEAALEVYSNSFKNEQKIGMCKSLCNSLCNSL